ncbi:MAG: hypothetical protein WCH39_13925 [Schlesneria sp.]
MTVARKRISHDSCYQLVLAAACFVSCGCGEYDRTSQFVPSVTVAESAVKAGMEAWKKGETVGLVQGVKKPSVHVVDSHRKPDQQLVSYEILGEVPGNAPRCFAVKATLSEPDTTERLRYIVVGIDPLWVFRQEDYDLLSHWEHPMEEKSKEAPAGE